MKNLFLTVLFTLVSVFSFSQQISVQVTELKDFVSNDSLSPSKIMKVATFDADIRTVDGSYFFDLDAKTVSFKTRKTSDGLAKINSSTEKNGVYTIVIEELNGVGNKMYITMVVDTVKNKVFFTYYDPINKYTLAQDFIKPVIKVSK